MIKLVGNFEVFLYIPSSDMCAHYYVLTNIVTLNAGEALESLEKLHLTIVQAFTEDLQVLLPRERLKIKDCDMQHCAF